MQLLLIAPVWILVFAVIGGLCTLSAILLTTGILVMRRRKRYDAPDFTQDALDIIIEGRNIQIRDHGFTCDRDDKKTHDELAIAAACYMYAPVYPFQVATGQKIPTQWPLLPLWWKPQGGRMKQLQKAGALLIAEMERQLRKEWYEEKRKSNGSAVSPGSPGGSRQSKGLYPRGSGLSGDV